MAATDNASPRREHTPSATNTSVLPSSIPQKRVLEDDHVPAVPSPLNPDAKTIHKPQVQIQTPEEGQAAAAMREKRAKKDSLKKREAKGGGQDSSRSTPDPKRPDGPAAELAPMRYLLAPPRPTDFEQSRGPVFTSHHEVQGPDGETIEFFHTSEHVFNKKNYHYTHCIADPAFPSMFYYRQTEPEPYGVHMSFEDTASHIYFDRAGRHVTSDKGFRMTRANVAVREGRWYWECKVTRGILKERGPGDPPSHGHVRMGWARREAPLDAPVGFDAYSYGIRDVQGQKVHMSRPKDFFPAGEDIKEGDVIGLEIQLPSESLHRKVVTGQYNPAVDLLDEEKPEKSSIEAPNIIRDRLPIRFKSNVYFEKIDYHPTKELEDLMNPSPMAPGSGPSAEAPNPNHALPPLRTLPNSHIKIYRNGVLMGTPWTDLLAFLPPASKLQQQQTNNGREFMDDGSLGYSPAVSVFRGGAVEVNFGPDFWYPPPGMPQKKKIVTKDQEKEAVPDQNQDEDVVMLDADAVEEQPSEAAEQEQDPQQPTEVAEEMEQDKDQQPQSSEAADEMDEDKDQQQPPEAASEQDKEQAQQQEQPGPSEAEAEVKVTIKQEDQDHEQHEQEQTAEVSLPEPEPEQPKLRPVFERYDEQIVEDIVYDIIDEVGFWMSSDRSGKGDEKNGEGAAGLLPGGGREEIKELVQDD